MTGKVIAAVVIIGWLALCIWYLVAVDRCSKEFMKPQQNMTEETPEQKTEVSEAPKKNDGSNDAASTQTPFEKTLTPKQAKLFNDLTGVYIFQHHYTGLGFVRGMFMLSTWGMAEQRFGDSGETFLMTWEFNPDNSGIRVYTKTANSEDINRDGPYYEVKMSSSGPVLYISNEDRYMEVFTKID